MPHKSLTKAPVNQHFIQSPLAAIIADSLLRHFATGLNIYRLKFLPRKFTKKKSSRWTSTPVWSLFQPSRGSTYIALLSSMHLITNSNHHSFHLLEDFEFIQFVLQFCVVLDFYVFSTFDHAVCFSTFCYFLLPKVSLWNNFMSIRNSPTAHVLHSLAWA